MAKRPLGGAGDSRLGKLNSIEADPAVRPNIKKSRIGRRRNHTVRLSGTEETRLQRLVRRTSEEAGRPISEAEIMRGLLVLGDKAQSNQLLESVRQAAFDAD